jgi:adenylate kinase family enzyme
MNRLETYHQQTEPLVDYYKKNNTLYYDIDANGDVDGVSDLLFEDLDALVSV